MKLERLGLNVFHSCLMAGLLWLHCLYECYNISRNYIFSLMWGRHISLTSTFELQMLTKDVCQYMCSFEWDLDFCSLTKLEMSIVWMWALPKCFDGNLVCLVANLGNAPWQLFVVIQSTWMGKDQYLRTCLSKLHSNNIWQIRNNVWQQYHTLLYKYCNHRHSRPGGISVLRGCLKAVIFCFKIVRGFVGKIQACSIHGLNESMKETQKYRGK